MQLLDVARLQISVNIPVHQIRPACLDLSEQHGVSDLDHDGACRTAHGTNATETAGAHPATAATLSRARACRLAHSFASAQITCAKAQIPRNSMICLCNVCTL